MTIGIDVKTAKTGFWHLPTTFYAVLFIEFWERFAFYGLQSVAVIYFVQQYGITEANADNLFASFSALLYAMLTIGGAIGDKVLGLRRTYFLGIAFLIVGYTMLSFSAHKEQLYLAMGLILTGNVFFKTNANNYVSRCFEANDPRLDSAFTYFYMSVNLGSFASIILVPILSKVFSYKVGLSLCALGMVIALIAYFLFRERFKLSDNQVGKNGKNMWLMLLLITLIGIVSAALFSFFLRDLALSKLILYFIAAVTIILYLFIASKLNNYEAKGMYIALILILQAVVFFTLYIQVATSMTLFAHHNVRLTFLGYQVPAGVTQSFNSLFIILFSPLLANLYISLYKKGINLDIPKKFAIGTLMVGACFILLAISSSFFADSNAKISVIWMVIAYMLFDLGELLVSALGASMVAQLLPKRFGGFAQGMWYLSSAIGMKLGGQMSSLAAQGPTNSLDNFASLYAYMNLFYKLGGITMAIGIILCFTIKPISRAMQQVLAHRY